MFKKSLKEGKVVIWDKLNDGKESFEQVKRDDLFVGSSKKPGFSPGFFWILCISIQGILLISENAYFSNVHNGQKVIINAFFAKNMLQ